MSVCVSFYCRNKRATSVTIFDCCHLSHNLVMKHIPGAFLDLVLLNHYFEELDVNYKSDDEREEEEEDISVAKDEEEGLTLGRLATMVRMATELQRVAQEWDPLMSRSLQFSNIIDGGMSVYKDLFAKKKKERQQLPITMFFSRTNTPASRPSKEENTAERSQDAAAQSEEQ
uniref:Uncharacterized protein n=1 Tax=Cynoglossus semilaevis TaxID=244447 RepID=A0A3P8WG57_CYNSE